MIEAHPTAVALADIYREEGSNPATALGFSLGSTCDPEHFQLPRVALRVRTEYSNPRMRYYRHLGVGPPPRPTPPTYIAHYQMIQSASEGSNRSLYVREGLYETNYTFELEDADQGDPQWRQKIAGAIKERRSDAMSRQFGYGPQPRVYFWVPAAMAERSRAAEQEHLDDHRRAYRLSLGAVNAALEQAEGRAAGEVAARQQADAAFLAALPVPVRGLAGNMERWGETYLALCAKSFGRDRGDHSFGLELVEPAAVPPLTVTYLAGAPREESSRIYVKVTAGTTRVPGHRTDDLIVY